MILTLFTRMQKNVHVDQLSRYIPDTHIEEEIQPAISVTQGKHEHNSGLIDISEMCLGELILQKK